MFSIFMKKFLYRKSHYKENCMKKVMISLSMLVFVLVLNSCDADSKSGAGSAIVHSFPDNPDSFSTASTGFRVVRSRD